MKRKMVDLVFDWCVNILIEWAKILGISYNEINVYIFCIIWPLFTIVLVLIILYQWIVILKLKRKQ